MHRMLEAVVVAQHHADFGLAIVVMDGDAKLIGKPADHFGVERLTGAADYAQLALDLAREGVTGGNQHAVRSG